MRNIFEQKLKGMDRELRDLQTARTMTPSVMATKTKTTAVTATIYGNQAGGGNIDSRPLTNGVAKITLNEPGLAMATVLKSTAYDTYRRVAYFTRVAADGAFEFVFYIEQGSSQDIIDLAGSSANTKALTINIGITATSEFTIQTYTENH